MFKEKAEEYGIESGYKTSSRRPYYGSENVTKRGSLKRH
jgi:hypothetical protein